jgi:hypothetical protein
MKFTIRLKGGAGSGHYGHKGIPGHKGGSLPRGGSASADTTGSNSYKTSRGNAISVVQRGTQISDKLSRKLSEQEDGVRVIYNTETHNWHIAEDDIYNVDHGDFSIEAMEGAEPDYTEQIQARGAFDIHTGELMLYDFTDMADQIGFGDFSEREVLYSLKKVMRDVTSGLFYYRDNKTNRIKKPVITWEPMATIMGG